jgi:hypothetical protein
MAGNLLGNRAKYVYKADDNKNYSVITDESLAAAGTGAAAAAPSEFDAANPPANYGGRFPRGATVRVVFVEDSAGNRKALTCFDPTSSLYQTNLAKEVEIDGTTFTSTGRRGEKMTF